MTQKYILGVFDDEEVLLKAIKNIRSSGVEIEDSYLPFPIHGMEQALGIKYTRIPVAAFLIGSTFGLSAFCFMWWVFAWDFPINFGGKPYGSFPSFIPPTFEATVLSTALGMAFILFTVCKLIPSPKQHPIDLRASDDKFVITIKAEHTHSSDKLLSLLKDNGAVEVNEKTI